MAGIICDSKQMQTTFKMSYQQHWQDGNTASFQFDLMYRIITAYQFNQNILNRENKDRRQQAIQALYWAINIFHGRRCVLILAYVILLYSYLCGGDK